MRASFASLFDPALFGDQLGEAIAAWQAEHLTPGALARVTLLKTGTVAGGDHVLVTFPSGETRKMAPGTSSQISKAVIEVFALGFLEKPGVIFLSESKNQVVSRDETLSKALGLHIKADKNLPDIILVDLGPKHPLFVFVEVVASDGPISQQRKEALLKLAREAGFPSEHVTFVTAYRDRNEQPFKKTVAALAWNTFVWFLSEPLNLMRLHEGGTENAARLTDWL